MLLSYKSKLGPVVSFSGSIIMGSHRSNDRFRTDCGKLFSIHRDKVFMIGAKKTLFYGPVYMGKLIIMDDVH